MSNVAGNYEQKASSREEGCGCNYTNDEDNHYGGIAHVWAMASLSEANRGWLGTWPDLAHLETSAGRILLCHGSPAQTNEFLYESELDDGRLQRWLDQHEAIGFVCGHSGFPWTRDLGAPRFAANCGVCGKPEHDHDAAVHYVSIDLTSPTPLVNIERVEYDHLAWADQLDAEGVDDVFTIPVRNGVWTCGLLSMPATERVLRPRPNGWLAALKWHADFVIPNSSFVICPCPNISPSSEPVPSAWKQPLPRNHAASLLRSMNAGR